MKFNQTYFLCLTLLVAMMINVSSVDAQTKRERLEVKQRIDQMVNTLKKELSLTKDQTEKVKGIVTENFKNAEKDRENFEGDREARMKMRMDRLQALDKKIELILTKEQKAKYEDYKKERVQRFQQMRPRQNERDPR
ncbi:MAG: hypothetical protein FJ213_11150 [Ignavibacteria bacterium]|nr:hypothetical protein [Ignavibacteria bacterium]